MISSCVIYCLLERDGVFVFFILNVREVVMMAYSFFKEIEVAIDDGTLFRGVPKGELRVLEPFILMAKIGKIWSENRGKFLKKREKQILSTSLGSVLDTPL